MILHRFYELILHLIFQFTEQMPPKEEKKQPWNEHFFPGHANADICSLFYANNFFFHSELGFMCVNIEEKIYDVIYLAKIAHGHIAV